jgi:hypothetical protein
MRRFADTIRFKWFQWVIEYDLARQLGVFKRVGDLVRGGTGGAAESVKRRWQAGRAWIAEHRVATSATLASLLLGIIGYVAWRRRRRQVAPAGSPARRQRDPVALLYIRALRALRRRGWPRPAATTPREHARALEEAGAPGAAAMGELTEIYYRVEYGSTRSDPETRARAAALAGQIQSALRAARRHL